MNRAFGVLMLVMMTMAQQLSPPEANDFGVIKGTVVDPDRKPVEGAVVHESSNDGRPLGGRLFRTSTTTDVDGNFVLDHVIPAEKVAIWAYKYDDYYEDVMEPFTFKRQKLEDTSGRGQGRANNHRHKNPVPAEGGQITLVCAGRRYQGVGSWNFWRMVSRGFPCEVLCSHVWAMRLRADHFSGRGSFHPDRSRRRSAREIGISQSKNTLSIFQGEVWRNRSGNNLST
jgi:hypothetical protein